MEAEISYIPLESELSQREPSLTKENDLNASNQREEPDAEGTADRPLKQKARRNPANLMKQTTASRQTGRPESGGQKPRKPVRKAGLTIPKTPAFMHRPQRQRTQKTTEELELEAINKGKQKLQRRLSRNKKALRDAQNPRNGDLPVQRPHRALTIPETPHFMTDQRLGKQMRKKRPSGVYNEEQQRRKEATTFRSSSVPTDSSETHSHQPRSLTVPIAPRFHDTSRSSTHQQQESVGEDGLTLAEKVHRLSTSVPSRFLDNKTFEKKAQHSGPKPQEARRRELTIASSPHFQTKLRSSSQARKVLSTEELEAEELKKQFKALPLNRHVFSSMGELGVPKIQKKELTNPEPFHFNESHASGSEQNYARDEEHETFHEHIDFSTQLRNPHSPIHVKEHHSLTIPEAPELRTSYRASAHLESHPLPPKSEDAPLSPAEQEELNRRRRESTSVRKSEGGLTVPEPFHFVSDMRGEAYQRHFQEMREQEDEKERRGHEVRMSGIYRPPPAPTYQQHEERPLTVPEEFNLSSVVRHEVYQQQLKRLSETEQRREEELRIRKARPLPRTTYEPVPPIEPEHVPPTIAHSPDFQTSKREQVTQSFIEQTRAHIEEQHLRELEAKEALLAEEEEETRRLRRMSYLEGGYMFEAREVGQDVPEPSHEGVAIEHRELTIPESPFLQTKLRANFHA